MMPSLIPIETKYNGRLYRSRLEARWAVFFEALGIKFEYEYEGYELSNGQWYLPDFYLPTFDGGLHAEVKPEGGDFFKAKMFADTYGERIWLCEGSPSCAVYKVYIGENCRQESWEFGEKFICSIPLWSSSAGEDRMFVLPCCFGFCKEGTRCRDEHPITFNDQDRWQFDNCDSGCIIEAVEKALSARF